MAQSSFERENTSSFHGKYIKTNMYSNVKFYEKDNKLDEIHFPVRLGGLKRINSPGENSSTSDFNVYVYIWVYIGVCICIYICISIYTYNIYLHIYVYAYI